MLLTPTCFRRTGMAISGSAATMARFASTAWNLKITTGSGFQNVDVLQLLPMANGEVFVSPFMSNLSYLKGDSVYDVRNDPELRKLNGHFTSNVEIRADSSKEKMCEFGYTDPKELFIYNKGRAERKAIDIKIPMAHYSIVDYDFKDKLILIGRMALEDQQELFEYRISR